MSKREPVPYCFYRQALDERDAAREELRRERRRVRQLRRAVLGLAGRWNLWRDYEDGQNRFVWNDIGLRQLNRVSNRSHDDEP